MSKEMKIIMEDWRDFFSNKPKEKQDPRDPIDPGIAMGYDKESGKLMPALFIQAEKGYHKIIIWKPTKRNWNGWVTDGQVLGMMWVSKTKANCIPDTYEVNFSAIDDQLKSKGVGSLLYGIGFHYVNNILDAGLTSDHSSNSNAAAQKMWDKYADTKNMVKKQTAAGNDEFDYDGKTPGDDDDDCSVGKESGITLKSMFFGKKYRSGVATHSSWIMQNNKFTKAYDRLIKRHEEYSKQTKKIRSLEDRLMNKSVDLFTDSY